LSPAISLHTTLDNLAIPFTMASTALTTLQNTKATVQRFEKKLTTPSTPSNIKQLLSTSTPQSASPGRWRHPDLATLASRQKRNSFDSSNVWTMLANVIALLFTWQWRDSLSHLCVFPFFFLPLKLTCSALPLSPPGPTGR
jgi:hypothetical protein